MNLKATNTKIGIVLFLSFLIGQGAVAGALIDPALRDFALSRSVTTKVIALFVPFVQDLKLPVQYDVAGVRNYYKYATQSTWNIISSKIKGTGNIRLQSLNWLNASATLLVTPAGLKELSHLPRIKKIYAVSRVQQELPFNSRIATSAPTQPGYSFELTGLSRLIQEQPQVDGKGVVLGSLEAGKGADANHPALVGKFLKYFDYVTKSDLFPTYPGSHSTHISGIIIGGDRTHIPIGVAPGAKLVQAGGQSDDDDAILVGMQFMLEPKIDADGKLLPRAVNNSWNSSAARDQELFYRAVTAWEAAGILPVFSAGNFGPGASSLTKPHEHPAVLTVGALGENGLITDYSSRGPGSFHGQDTKKPDLSAPGDQINSCIPEGDYGKMDGTSMAAPHVVGALALLAQVAPGLKASQLKDLILESVTPSDHQKKGEWDAAYGYGKLNIFEAVKLAEKFELYQYDREFNLSDRLFAGPMRVFFERVAADGAPRVLDSLFSFPENNQESGEWLGSQDIWK